MKDWKFLFNRYVLGRRITSDGLHWSFSLTDCVDHQEPFLESFILRKGFLFIDVGANAGAWSIRASPYYRRVIAFEPNHEIFRHLHRNMHRNRCHNIDRYEFALGNKNETLAQKTVPTANSNIGFAEGTVVTRRLDDLPDDVFPDQISVIKIDAEGAGYAIVEGGLRRINEQAPTLILEVHTQEESKVPELLSHYQFQRFYRDAAKDTWIWRENGKQLFLVGMPV